MVIVFGFQIPVDGWLTKLSAPIVVYDEQHTTRRPVSLRHPGRGLPVRFRAGDRGAAAVGAAAAARRPRQTLVTLALRRRARRRSTPGRRAYDRLVGANPGYHAHLRISAQRMRLSGPRPRAAAPRRRLRHRRSTAALLAVGAAGARSSRWTRRRACSPRRAAKPWPASVRFVHSRIEDLADAGVDGPFDGIFAAYLIRNLPDPDAQLRDVPHAAAPGRHPGRARLLGARLPAGRRRLERGVLDRHHPGGSAAHRRRLACTGTCGAA